MALTPVDQIARRWDYEEYQHIRPTLGYVAEHVPSLECCQCYGGNDGVYFSIPVQRTTSATISLQMKLGFFTAHT